MAAMSASQRQYNYGPGSNWGSSSQGPLRSPSSRSRDAYPSYDESRSEPRQYTHPYAMAAPPSPPPPPDVRVTAPSRAGEERRDTQEWDDDQSVYSERMSQTPQNFYSEVFQSSSPSSHHLSAYSSRSEMSRDSWQRDGTMRPDSNVDPFSFMKYESPRQQPPMVVVSSPSDGSFRPRSRYEDELDTDAEAIIPQPITPPPFQSPPGRVPSALQGARNFSRPSRAPAPDFIITQPESPSRPYVEGSEEQKREVLERNQRRQMLGQGSPRSQPVSPSASSSSLNMKYSSPSRSQYDDGYGGFQNDGSTAVSAEHAQSASPSHPVSQGPAPALSQSSSLSSTASGPTPRTPKDQGLVVLPSNPPGIRKSATESIYSVYSYYQYDNSATPSPSSPNFDQRNMPDVSAVRPSQPPQQPSASKKSKSSTPNPNDPPANPTTADDFLALGISHHEADRLSESAQCFEKSATLNGGCAVGMLMWGLSLRHGWGIPKDEPRAFKWLKKAAEHAVVDLQQGRSKPGRDAVKKELVLAVYEVGQCFFQGWGVPKDKVMGVSYFQTAAQLGDPDAQQDLAFCLANGKGCKKDRKAAAKWYRAAAAQGASTIGLAWIYKPKYAD